MTDPPRAVRIARPRSDESSVVPPSSTTPDATTATGAFVTNDAGAARALRLFLVFVLGLGVLYILFLALEFSGPSGSGGYSWGAVFALTVVGLAAGILAYSRTIARAPRGIFRRTAELVVAERRGRVRRFPFDSGFRVEVVERHRAGGFSPGPTELVKLFGGDGTSRTYLVSQGLIPEWARAPPASSQ